MHLLKNVICGVDDPRRAVLYVNSGLFMLTMPLLHLPHPFTRENSAAVYRLAIARPP